MSKNDAPIQLVDYDPRWPRLFAEEQALLRRVLGPWLVGPLEHVGSTAVPGLGAKPVIDMMGAVETLDRSKPAIAAVKESGYLYAPYRADQEHWFCKPSPSFRTHHLHLVPLGSRAWIAAIAFRDRLRADRAAAAEYLTLKRDLCSRYQHDREAYTEGKSQFVKRIVDEELRKITPAFDHDRCPGSRHS